MTLFAALTTTTARLGHSPAVVFRDAGTAERTELSFATLHNWVCKAANLLADELEVGLGEEVEVTLPLHWMGPVICLATWATGGAVRIGEPAPAGSDHPLVPAGQRLVRVAHEGDAADGEVVEADLVIGSGMAAMPLGEVDDLTVRDVLAQPDDFVDDPGDDGAWAIGGRTQLTLAAESVDERRVLVVGDRFTDEHAFLVARTIPAGASLVLARGYDAAGLAKVEREEGLG